MKKRLIGVLAFALAVSAGAAFVLYQLIASRMTVGASSKPTTIKVLVASRDLETGRSDSGAGYQDAGVSDAAPGSDPQEGRHRQPRRDFTDSRGRAVLRSIARAQGAGAGFAATIPTGMRAFAVHVNEVVGVAGFAVAGMRVDLLVSGTPPGSGAGRRRRLRHADPAAEHSGSFGRAELPKGCGREAGSGAGGQSAGDSRTG